MSDFNFNIIKYEDIYFDQLKKAYELSFNKKFFSKDIYKLRFKYNNIYSSYLLIDSNKKIVGHLGFRIHLLNNNSKNKIAFRFSTFIIPSYRGSGFYLKMMEFVKIDLKEKFEVDFIYAWPNKINLLSCLKDKDYINLNPILTWQHVLEDKFVKENSQNIKYDFLHETDLNLEFKTNDNQLTFDSKDKLISILKDRFNKTYKIIYLNSKKFAIVGITYIDNKEYLSIVINNNLEVSAILNKLSQIHKNKNTIIQCWCFHEDYNLLRQLIKNNFNANGPIFYNGIYSLNNKKFPLNRYFPNMYNHDAF